MSAPRLKNLTLQLIILGFAEAPSQKGNQRSLFGDSRGKAMAGGEEKEFGMWSVECGIEAKQASLMSN